MPAAVKLYISKAGNPGNPAICTHYFDIPSVTGPQLLAQVMAAYTSFEGICASQQIDLIEANFGDAFGPLLPQPHPTVQYAALKAANPALVAQPGYGSPYGLANSMPAGLALLVREATAMPRKNWGRSFLPWPSNFAAVPATGSPSAAATQGVIQFSGYLRGTPAGCTPATPVVRRGTLVSSPSLDVILNYSLSPNFGRLRSRLR